MSESRSHDILDVIGDRITSYTTGFHEGVPPSSRSFLVAELSDFITRDPVEGWLLNDSKISPEAIRKVISRLPQQLEDKPKVDIFFKALYGENWEPEIEKNYDGLVGNLCTAIGNDIRKNRGGKFKKIINRTSLSALEQILDNEDIRQWLKNRPGGPNIYDLEEAVVSATILHMAAIYDEYIQELEAPRSEN